MEYLVTMTTHVPDGTAPETVGEVRAREAARSRELAAAGHLLRLWRPPLRPGEWRTIGLFAADDVDELGKVLASMPLRIWRADEVTPLPRHPNDPMAETAGDGTEFFTIFTRALPDGTPREDVSDAEAREAARAKELGGQGHLLRLWVLPGQGRALGLWRAGGAADLQAMLDSLPLRPFMTVDVTPLTEHPSDPAIARR
ncbi:MAG: muconolactone Delta-isomerase family protein [Streptosporangiaceae bacterium]